MCYIISQIWKNAGFLLLSFLYKEDTKSIMLVMYIKITLVINTSLYIAKDKTLFSIHSDR